MQAYIFEGGELIDGDNVIEIAEWTPEAIEQAFVEFFGEDWANTTTDMYRGGDRTMRETIDVVNETIAQSLTCSVDGGMTYLVRETL